MTRKPLAQRRARLLAEGAAQRAALELMVQSLPAPRDLLASVRVSRKALLVTAAMAAGFLIVRPRRILALLPAAAGLWKLARPLLETVRQAASAAKL